MNIDWNLILTQLKYGGGIFLFGFSIVFVGLIVLLTYISLQSLFFKKNTRKKAKPVVPKAAKEPSNDFVSQVDTDENELIAVISAAVAMALGTSAGNVVIKSYRRIGANTPAWRQAGRRDSIFNKF